MYRPSASTEIPAFCWRTQCSTQVVLIKPLPFPYRFFVAYEDPIQKSLVTCPAMIRRRYLRFFLWLDVLTTFPFAGVILTAVPSLSASSSTELWISLIGLLKIGRLYDTPELFELLERSMIVGHAVMTIVRNLFYILFTSHWFACLFYFAARVNNFSKNSWIGRSIERFIDQPLQNQ